MDDFVEVAQAYCALIEECKHVPKDEFISQLRRFLPRLYLEALELGKPELPGEDNELGDVTHEQWLQMFKRLQEYLGQQDLYWTIYDLRDPDVADSNGPVCGSLADDLADIWRDLTRGVIAWPNANATTRQHIAWQSNFHQHFVYHLVDALRVISVGDESFEWH